MKFKATPEAMDILLIGIDDLFLILSLIMQFCFGIELWILIAILGVVGICGTWMLLFQPIYCFKESEIEVLEHFPIKNVKIPYEDVITYDLSGNFQSVISKARHRIVLTFKTGEKYRNYTFNPKDVYGFIEALERGTGKTFR